MEMNIGEILGYVISFVGGGGLMTLITAKSLRKKAAVDVKTDEIKALRDAVDMVYKPLLDTQKDRIQELESEVKSLREQLKQERKDRQEEINLMNKRIVEITSALGMKAVEQIQKTARRKLSQQIDIEPAED